MLKEIQKTTRVDCELFRLRYQVVSEAIKMRVQEVPFEGRVLI
jgi:hypothetical protein